MNNQIARAIFLTNLTIMKKTLDLIEFGMDMRTNKYKYAKSQIMDFTYDNLTKLFKQLVDLKLIKKCKCGTNLRKGYRKCDCGGSGFVSI